MSPNNGETFEYLYQHMMLIGWPTIFYFAWRVSKWVSETTAVFTKAVSQVDTMATNCFPTMQSSLQNQDELLKSVDGSLKVLVDRTPMAVVTTQPVARKRKR